MERFECTLDDYLAELLERRLFKVLEAAGFRMTLRLAEPHITQFQHDSELVTVNSREERGHKRTITVESETTDVKTVVGPAVGDAIREAAWHLAAAAPWVERSTLLEGIDQGLPAVLKGGPA